MVRRTRGASQAAGLESPSAVAIDDELTTLALAADPDQPPDPDAVPLGIYLHQVAGPLPEWYMPPATARRVGPARRLTILTLVGSFLLIEAFGLCSTYGQLPFH